MIENNYSKEELIELIKSCNTKKEIFLKLGYKEICNNISWHAKQKWYKIFNDLGIEYSKIIEENQNKLKGIGNKHICKNCGKEFHEKHSKYASWDFCSQHCASQYSQSFIDRNKVSESLKEYYKNNTVKKNNAMSNKHILKYSEYEQEQPKCCICGKLLTYKQFLNNQVCCSKECVNKKHSITQKLWNHEYGERIKNREGNYIVYKITSKIDDSYYIGVHLIKNDEKIWNDNYYGSGIIIKAKIKKYGKENFIREVLEWFNNSTDAYEYEKKIVNESIDDKKCVNIAHGGIGGPTFKGRHHTEETKQKLREISSGKHLTEETKQKLREKNKGRIFSEETRKKISEKAKERYSLNNMSNKSKEKISESLIAYYDAKGRKNKKRIKREKLNLDIDKNGKQCYIYKDDKEYRVYKEELEYYLNNGWKIGRNPLVREKLSQKLKGSGCGKNNSAYGTKWMYNDKLKQTKMIKPELIEEYLNNGWKFGCKNKIYNK